MPSATAASGPTPSCAPSPTPRRWPARSCARTASDRLRPLSRSRVHAPRRAGGSAVACSPTGWRHPPRPRGASPATRCARSAPRSAPTAPTSPSRFLGLPTLARSSTSTDCATSAATAAPSAPTRACPTATRSRSSGRARTSRTPRTSATSLDRAPLPRPDAVRRGVRRTTAGGRAARRRGTRSSPPSRPTTPGCSVPAPRAGRSGPMIVTGRAGSPGIQRCPS